MTARIRPWWQSVAAEAGDSAEPIGPPPSGGTAGGREPWADHALAAAALTPAQEAVLAGLDDQPDGPRLDNLSADDQLAVPRLRPGNAVGRRPGNGTGNAPGDAEPPDPHTRTRWTEREQEG